MSETAKSGVRGFAVRMKNLSNKADSQDLFHKMREISRKMYYLGSDEVGVMSSSDMRVIKDLMYECDINQVVIDEFQGLIDLNDSENSSMIFM